MVDLNFVPVYFVIGLTFFQITITLVMGTT